MKSLESYRDWEIDVLTYTLITMKNKAGDQFVTYPIAKKLQELGFNQDCFGYFSNRYDKIDEEQGIPFDEDTHIDFRLTFNCDKNLLKTFSILQKPLWFTLAPLWQEAIDWLETKGYYIYITRVFLWNTMPPKFEGWAIHIATNNPKEYLDCNEYYVSHFFETKHIALETAIHKVLEIMQLKDKNVEEKIKDVLSLSKIINDFKESLSSLYPNAMIDYSDKLQ